MSKRSSVYTCARAAAVALALFLPAAPAAAADIQVPAGGNLQAALDAAQPGDTILLAPGATYVGNFVLPVHGGTTYVTLRTSGNDALLPGPGTRITPAHAPYLAKLRSPNSVPALRTAARAAYWRIMLLEFRANANGAGDIMQLGNPSTAQNSLDLVPRHLIVDRVYMHGDPLVGQKRGIHLNSADTLVINSHIDEMKAIGQDTQALGGANGPGPFRIENNHLEAAGEVFILGGDDPKIPGLVTSDVIVRGNTLRRPVSWRDPIVPTPAGISASAAAGGSLAAGTYAYRVVARRPAGTTTATSAASAEVSAVAGAGGGITVRWTAVPHATSYRVYGRTPGGQTMYWTVETTSFTDTGAAGTVGPPPLRGTVWQVKNLFELKNARRVQVDYNLMENNWLQAQSGVAVLFTVRNQYGGCPHCVVEDVTFEYNIIRNVGSGITVLGYDNNHPSQQTNNIRIRHNEFSGLDRAWGGNGYFMALTDQPRDIVVDHNTIVSPNGMGVLSVQGPPVYGFVFTNNVMRHNIYGLKGAGTNPGTTTINTYFPDGVIRRNVLAGGRASLYPADNVFPTTAVFEAHFVSYAGGDFALAPGTDWAGAGTDAEDLGANMARLRAGFGGGGTGGGGDGDGGDDEGGDEGGDEGEEVAPLSVVTQSLPATREFAPYSATLEAVGGLPPYQWAIRDGSLPAGISLDPLTGTLAGSAAAAGEFVFTVQVTDSAGASASQPLTLRADPEIAIAPVEILTTELSSGTVNVGYNSVFQAAGGLGSYVWSVTAGAHPAGLTLSSGGQLSGTPGTAGTWTFTVTAQDAQDPARHASRAFTLIVVSPPPPPPNTPPSVSVRLGTAGVIPVGATVTLIADATDADGTISRVDFVISGLHVGTAVSPPYTVDWVAREGSHMVTATAVDDDGAQATSVPLTIPTTPEIVLYASDVQQMAGDFQLVPDPTAADGMRLWNPNRDASRLLEAAEAPASYAEFTFYAEAWRPYRLWIRGSGEGNFWGNDSAYLQFSGALDRTGRVTSRIGTTSAMWYSVEEYAGAGLLDWGWQDNGFGLDVDGSVIYFERTGPQTLRIQPSEDGISIDQIVISPSLYRTSAPGLPKGDATIVAQP